VVALFCISANRKSLYYYSVSRLNKVQIYFSSFRSAKFILRVFGVQNLFCVFSECKIYFACFWSAKFILRLFWSAKFILRLFWSAKFILRVFGVQNLFGLAKAKCTLFNRETL
jgi:hypothetical protein